MSRPWAGAGGAGGVTGAAHARPPARPLTRARPGGVGCVWAVSGPGRYVHTTHSRCGGKLAVAGVPLVLPLLQPAGAATAAARGGGAVGGVDGTSARSRRAWDAHARVDWLWAPVGETACWTRGTEEFKGQPGPPMFPSHEGANGLLARDLHVPGQPADTHSGCLSTSIAVIAHILACESVRVLIRVGPFRHKIGSQVQVQSLCLDNSQHRVELP